MPMQGEGMEVKERVMAEDSSADERPREDGIGCGNGGASASRSSHIRGDCGHKLSLCLCERAR